MLTYKVDGLIVTPLIRWVMRNGEKVLQQAFREDDLGDLVYRPGKTLIWKDVPVWEEDGVAGKNEDC